MKTSPRIRAPEVGQSPANSRRIHSEGPALSASRLPMADCVGRGVQVDLPSGTLPSFHSHSSFQSDPDSPLHLPPPLSHSHPPSQRQARPKRRSIHARVSVTSKQVKCSGIDLSDRVSRSPFPPAADDSESSRRGPLEWRANQTQQSRSLIYASRT